MLTRRRDIQSKVSESTFQSKAFGARENKSVNTEGRIVFDVLQVAA
jgi:DNA polymerase delta subunit 1